MGRRRTQRFSRRRKLVLYHRTRWANAQTILWEGFKDHTGYYLTDTLHTGVWLSDVPLDENEGACGDTLLKVTLQLSKKDLGDYEWKEEGKGYRKWLVPAELVNRHGRAEIVEDEVNEIIRRSNR